MTSLKENLSALSSTLPDIPSALGELVEEGQRLSGAVTDFLNALAEKEAQAAAMLGEVEQALAGVEQRGESERIRLEEQLTEFEKCVNGNLTDLENDQEDLTQRVEAAGTAVAGLKDALVEAGTSARAAEEEVARQLGELKEAAHDGERELYDACEEVAREAEALEQGVDEAGRMLRQALEGLGKRVQDLAQQAGQRVERTRQKLQELQSAHEAEVAEQGSRLDEGRQVLLGEMQDRAARELEQPVAAPAQAALDVIAELKAEGLAAAAGCREGGETVEALLGGLRAATRPLPQAIEAVRRAAVQVGLPWG
jgi:hypothetical protein